MTYVITEACIQAAMCASVCPVDCIYDAGDHFIINPEECIDCGLCDPECPVDAIYPDYQLPDETGVPHRLSELQGADNLMVLHLSRGEHCRASASTTASWCSSTAGARWRSPSW